MTAVAELSECCASVGRNTAEQQECEQVEKLQAQLAVQHLYQVRVTAVPELLSPLLTYGSALADQ